MRRILLLALAFCVSTPLPALAQTGKKPAGKKAAGKKAGNNGSDKKGTDKKEHEEKAPEGKPVRVKLKVLDVAAGRAYLEPGEDAELRPGDEVRFGRQTYEILATSASFSVIDLGKDSLDVGAQGQATVIAGRKPEAVEPVKPPAKLASFRGEWLPAALPADSQNPDPVPLGLVQERSPNRLRLSASAFGVLPLSDGTSVGHGELRAQLHYEPFTGSPFEIDADIAAQGFIAQDLAKRDGGDARPVIRVRQLEAAYGTAEAWRGALGRLRYASHSVGTLDGVRVQAPLTDGLILAAFGGAVPEPLSGVPSGHVARFGGEAVYQDLDSAWRPHVAIGGHASRFDGELDERRVSAQLDLLPKAGRFSSYGEVSFFDSDNPWNADTTELSAVGVDSALRVGFVELGGRFDRRTPEKSRWLASFFPPEWLCSLDPQAVNPTACLGNDAVITGGGDLFVVLEKVRLGVGARHSETENVEAANTGGFAQLRWLDIVGRVRLEAGASAQNGTLVSSRAMSLSPGWSTADGSIDVALRYRPALVRYAVEADPFIEHTTGGSFWFSADRSFDFSLDGDWITGRDIDVVVLQSTVAWRPGI